MKIIPEIVVVTMGYLTIGFFGVIVIRLLIDGISNLIDRLRGYRDGFNDGYKSAIDDLSRGKNPGWRNAVCADCAYFSRVPVTFGGVPNPDVTHPRCTLCHVTFLDLEDVTRHQACPEWQPRQPDANRANPSETAPKLKLLR